MISRPGRPLTSRRPSSLLLILLAIVLILPGGPSFAQSSDDLDAIRKRLADANAQTERVLNEIKALDNRIFSVTRSIAQGETEVGRAESGVRRAEEHIEELDQQIAEVRRSANARAARMYKNGPSSILAPLFTSTTLSDLFKLQTFWESLAQRDGRTLVEANRLRTERDEEMAALAQSIRQLEERVESLDAQRESLRADRSRRAAALQGLRVAIQEAMEAERRVLATRAAAVKTPAPAGTCTPGMPARDQRLNTLLDWYSPKTGSAALVPDRLEATGVVNTGDASWYGPGFDGCRSASGATFRAAQMTAASTTLPMGTFLKVTRAGRAVVVVITDRGPYAHGRVLDLSQAAAQAIGLGAGPVEMEILLPTEPAPPFP